MTLLVDLRYACRLLARSPIFSLTSVVSLAVGIAASTAIFSITDALLLRRPTGIVDPDRLVDIGRSSADGGFDNFGYPLFQALRERSTLFESMAAIVLGAEPMSLGDGTSSERVYAGQASASYFQLLGTRLAYGRFFLPDDDRVPGERPVIVLSHAFWMRRFGASPDIVGRQVQLNGLSYTVVGVAEEGFTGSTIIAPDFWVPISMAAHVRGNPGNLDLLTSHDAVWHWAIGRLKPEVSRAQARDELNGILAAMKQDRPDAYAQRAWSIAVEPSAVIPTPGRGPVTAFIGLLFALTAIVLMIACSNMAGMLLARATARRREVATRLAVGADRRRLMAQLLTETTAIFLVAGLVAMLLAFWLVRGLESFLPALPLPIAVDFRVDFRVLTFALGVALITGLVFGLAPARHALRLDLAPSLHGEHLTTDRRRFALRHALVVGQVALSLLLLVTTGLFLRALQVAADVNPGFDPTNVHVVTLDTSLAGYRDQDAVRFVDRVLERVRAVSGVEVVGTSRMIPLFGGGMSLGGLRAPGTTSPAGTDEWSADWDVVSPDYFRALRVLIVQGRGFTDADRDGATLVGIVNETFARRVWPGQSAVGQRLLQTTNRNRAEDRPIEIVGVARDAKYRSLGDGPRNFIYVPFAQQPSTEVNFHVRHATGRRVVDDVRAIVQALDSRLPVLQTQPLEEAIGIGLLPQRLAAAISASVGTVGLLLAALGLYGITAFSVAQRTREIAVRMALGASSASVLRMVLRQGGRLAAIGGGVGLLLATAAGLLVRSLLHGVPALDPVSFASAGAVLVSVLLLATWFPARRAAEMNPMQALRSE